MYLDLEEYAAGSKIGVNIRDVCIILFLKAPNHGLDDREQGMKVTS